MKLRIAARIAAGLSAIVLLLVALGWFAHTSADALSRLTEQLYRHPFAVTNALGAADASIIAMNRSMKDVVLARDAADIDRAVAEVDRREGLVLAQFAIVRERFLGDKSKLDVAAKAFADWRPIRAEVVRLAREGRRDEAAEMVRVRGAAAMATINKPLGEMAEFAQNKAVEFMTVAAAAAERTRLTIVGAILAAVVLAVVFGALTIRSITRPVRALRAAMLALADGDLDVVVPATGRTDEIGEMAKAVEIFKSNAIDRARLETEQRQAELHAAEQRRREMNRLADGFESAIGGIVGTVSAASSRLETAATSLSRTADTTRDLSDVVAGASEEASANVRSVASSTEELTGSVAEIARQVQESTRIARAAVDQAARTDARIGQLSEAAGRIGDVVSLIRAIAEQTNLLALNATIEAARAGEAGRGFAVVASEVKQLAAQTAKATEEIGNQIGAMQSATQASVGAIKEIGGTIDRIAEISAAVAAAVEAQGAATGEIARNVQQAAAGTTKVASNIGSVSHGAAETGTASSQVLASARALAEESRHLRQEVERFVATVRAA